MHFIMDIIQNEKKENNGDLKNSIDQNRELLERIYESTEKTRRYIFWLHVITVVKIILIIVPAVILMFFVAPMLKEVVQIYTGGFEM
jgi:type IV secretory pathway component VirB8